MAPLWRIVTDTERIEELYRLCGDFCHAVRNRLNSFQLCLYLSHPDGLPAEDNHWKQVEAGYREALRLIDLIQTICRPMRLDLMPLALSLIVEDRAESWSEQLASRGIIFETRPPAKTAQGWLDPMQWTRALDGLIAWRQQSAPAETRVTIGWREGGGELWLDWEESPTTVPAQPAPTATAGTSGALALALLARVVHEHGGTIEHAASPEFHVELRWPSRSQDPGSATPRGFSQSGRS